MCDYLSKKTKKLLTLMAMLAVAVGVLAPTSNARVEEVLKIGILQYVEHESLTANREGFIEGLKEAGYIEGENLEIEYLNAASDNANLQSMSETLANHNDYLFGISTPAAQSLAVVESDKPIYFSSVSDPVGAKLIKSLDHPGTNLTGTVDAAPIEEQLELLLSIQSDIQKVGLLYNSGEANSESEASIARKLIEEKGLETVEGAVTSTNDISQVLDALVKESEAIFLVTDNTIASAMALVGNVAAEHKIPIVGGSIDMIETNGLATYGLDYYDLGIQTAQMLVRQIEEGTATSDVPVETAEQLHLFVNEEYAKKIDVDPSSIQAPTKFNESSQ